MIKDGLQTMPAVDLKRLAAEVSVLHGIRVDPDDPMMAIVTLNRMLLEEAVAKIIEELRSATCDLQNAAEKVQLRAGARLARDIRECAAAIQTELRASTWHPHRSADISPADPSTANGRSWIRRLAIPGLFFLAGVGVGLSFWML